MARNQRNQKASRSQSRSDMKVFYGILIAVAVVGVVAVGYSVGSTSLGETAAEPVELEIENLDRLVQMARGIPIGDASAPVTVLEFADYQCPACATFALQYKPHVVRELVETGKVRFVFHDFPLPQHPHSFLAARAARCAGDQERYWEYSDLLFQRQSEWGGERAPAGTFVGYAEDTGLDAGAFESCLRSDEHAETVTANYQLGRELGVPGTPTIYVSSGGMPARLGSFDYGSVQRAVEQALASSGAPAAAPDTTGGGDTASGG